MIEDKHKDVLSYIEKSQKILIISHRKPDADTLGAALALRLWLGSIGKEVTLACVDKPDEEMDFFPYLGEFVNNFDLKEFDLRIIVDAGASYMTNFHLKYANFFESSVPIINIDHHASNDHFGKVNIVDPVAPSTTVMLYRMFKELGVTIDADIATCLLAGIYGDTGGFMHSNTDKEVYKVSADLMSKGANVKGIIKSLFKSKSLETLRLWGKVLEKVEVTTDGVVMSVVKDEDYEQVGSTPEQLSGVVDYLNMVPDTKFAVLLNEDRKGNVKGSFRTRQTDLDLSRIAAVFGGGGHPKASGFMLPGKIQANLKYTIVSEDLSKRSLEF
ncbi:MAG: bifunctional oligoribonuclease/PAP phosphatase NrnA [Candidatus Peregrinibacteria bacterium]|nr:bifunctional oligoribonuclease/PAP phosphatase NrnA [Candidatus Peregrinibacteria bacterium]